MSKAKQRYSASDSDYSSDEEMDGLAQLNSRMEQGIREGRETNEERKSRPPRKQKPTGLARNDRFKRKIFKKIGYEGYDKDEAVPDEIFQMLWLIQ